MNEINLNPLDNDKLKEECGVFAIFNSNDACVNTSLGLHALQHRGQEAAGIVTCDRKYFSMHFADGLVSDTFNSPEIVSKLEGDIAIGHVRYSTAGKKTARNYQPIFVEYSFGCLALAHNGNLTNAKTLRKHLIKKGAIFQTTMDSEVIVHLIAQSSKENMIDRIVDAVNQIKGAYSLLIMHKTGVIAIRDPRGVRPLVMGNLNNSTVFASETCALDIIGADFQRDVKPGEMIVIDDDGIKSSYPFKEESPKFCIFEYIYFARPDSTLEGKNVYEMRKNIGMELAKEVEIDADLVVPVPDSGVPAAIGYSQQSKIPFELGIIRNHYVGRTFIEPSDRIRHFGVKLKHNANLEIVRGKKVVLIDDSIVRGTTSKKIVQMMRDAGAKEVHMLIASPPTTNPCFYGVDTPNKEKLMAANYSVEEMAKMIGADKLAFISIEGLYKAVGEKERNSNSQYCDACFTSDYAIELVDKELIQTEFIKNCS